MSDASRNDGDLTAGTVLEDSGGVVRNYADALLAAAGDEAGDVLDELGAIVSEVVRGQPGFASLMGSPSIGPADRDRVLAELFGARSRPTVVNFLRVLNRHGRLGLLAGVVAQARAAWDRKQGRRPVTVRTAVPLDDDRRRALEGKLATLIGATPVLTIEVDPSLIAGLVVQVGDDVYDASVRTRLARLRDRLIERKTHAQV